MRPESSPSRQHERDPGFTAVICQGAACARAADTPVLTELRACVRRHRHGVLVSAGCLLGRLACHALTSAHRPPGPLLVVQRCRPDRTPVGAALWVGPLRDAEDVATVCRWLDAGELSVLALPARLRFRATLGRRGAVN